MEGENSMSNINQFRGNRVPVSLGSAVYTSAGEFPAMATTNIGRSFGANVVSTGSTTAGVYKQMVSVTGSGVLKFAAFLIGTSNSQIFKLRIVLDGVTALEIVTPNANMTSRMIPGVGSVYYDDGTTGIITPTFEDIPFNSSLSIDVSTGNTEGGAGSLSYKYHTY
jgi:hypothetical protein